MAKGNETATRLAKLEKEVLQLQKEKKLLEDRVSVLEDQYAISRNTSAKLKAEVDRLDQYQRRSNILIKNVEVSEPPNQADDKKLVHELIRKDLKLPNAVAEIDKLHRLGRKRTNGGKTTQDIIVKFKTHSARYDVYDKRKESKNLKIRPNLSKYRSDLLYRASKMVEQSDPVHFVFANAHGDIKLRLKEKPDGNEQYHDFSSISELKTILNDLGIEFVDEVELDDVEE